MFPYSKTLLSKLFTIASLCGLLFLPSPGALGAAGDVDPTFHGNIVRTFSDAIGSAVVNKIVVQPDQKILIAGNFKAVSGAGRMGIARLNPDGTPDTGFFPPDIAGAGTTSGTITALALLPNGRIVIGGNFQSIGGRAQQRIAMLNADGTLYTAFNPTANPGSGMSSTTDPGSIIFNIHTYPNSSFLVVGSQFSYHPGGVGTGYANIIRFNSDGTLDTSLHRGVVSGGTLYASTLLSDGKILVAGNIILRLTANGADDPSWMAPVPLFNGRVLAMVEQQPDNKILVGGEFTTANNFTFGRMARLNSNGTIDGSFNTATGASGSPATSVRSIKLTPTGQILVAGSFTNFNGFIRNSLARLDSNGNLDSTFVPPTSNTAYNDAAVQSDNEVVAGTSAYPFVLRRFETDGAPDANFQVLVQFSGFGDKILALPDGRVLVSGSFNFANNVERNLIARFETGGALDTNFTQTTFSIPNTHAFALAYQADGKILSGIQLNNNAVRLNQTGTLDFTFPNTANPLDIEALPDGRIVIAGVGGLFKIFNAGGTLLSNYNGWVNASIYEVLVQPDGKILVVGNFTHALGIARPGIARFNTDGSLDTAFNPQGITVEGVREIELQPDGKIIIGGTFTAVNFDLNQKYLARLNADGSFDTSFTPIINQPISALKLETGNRILIGGFFTVVNGAARTRIARLTTSGALDLTFGGSGANDTVHDFDVQADGKILVTGDFTKLNNFDRVGLARLLNPSRTLFDFDGDNKSDVSLFRPSTGFWYVSRSSDNSFQATQFGDDDDKLAPADYDGDGKTDLGVFRPADGTWYLLQSTNGFAALQFGVDGDIPVPGDFDGDGRANLAVFRRSAGSWYIARATGIPSQNFDSIPFGADGDKPIAGGDFDGDGRTDAAVFRPSNGYWYRLNSSNGQFVAVQFGIEEDKPVAADYDADGKTDLGVFRPTGGVWYRLHSGTGSFTATQFGAFEDRPSPADFDGDGRADLAVFRPSQGIWYLLRSTAGFTAAQFGTDGDLPAPNAFVR